MDQFQKFCVVGAFGFIVDSGCFIFLNHLSNETMLCRLIAFWCAATTTWYANRCFTFKNHVHISKFKQWSKHMFVAHCSGALNLLLFWILLPYFAISIAFVSGIIAGLLLNYSFSKYFVFTSKK